MNTREAGRPARLSWKRRCKIGEQWTMVDEQAEGVLLGIGSEVEEAEGSVASYTTAFLEMPDGSVKSGPLHQLQFLDKVVELPMEAPSANPA
jgi:hypothetical protein